MLGWVRPGYVLLFQVISGFPG